MAGAAVFLTAVVVYTTLSSTYATRGVIITAPRSMEKNTVNKIYMSFYDIGAPGTVAISLQHPDTKAVLAEVVTPVEKDEKEKVINLKVPDTTNYYHTIWANGTFDTEDGYSFFQVDEVYLHTTQGKLTFIQTDKPLYKPGQQVKFRILPLSRRLKPLGKDVQGDIWVEDTSGSRMAQWKNVSFERGLEQFDFPLSNEPPLGYWKITANIAGVTDTSTFEVKEYVLPTFEVTLTPPPFVLANAESFPVEICARYTYGKPVKGSLKINSSLETYSWSSEKYPVYEAEEEEINGCYTYIMNISLVDKEYTYIYRNIKIIAEVTEKSTGVVRNGSVLVARTHDGLKLEFLNDEYNQYFKPGIPFQKMLKVTKPDHSPASDEEVQVCATMSRQRVMNNWWATRKIKFCRNYTSDENGLIHCKVPPQKPDTISLYLEAKSYKFEESSSAPARSRIYQPQTSTSVQPYYSPSKSYLQVQNIEDTLKCGTSQKIKVLYTAEDGRKYVFHYHAISKGEVVLKGSKEVTFSDADNVAASMCKDPSAVNEVRIPLVPAAHQIENTDEDVDCNPGPIGAAEIDVEITSAVSPSMRLLVFYIRDDDEIVADSTLFKVEKCFQNNVEFKFNDEEKQPGAKTFYTLKASPSSLCGTKVLDKSVSLLNSNDPLTKEKVFEELKKFEPYQYYRRDHCNDKFPKGGKYNMAIAHDIVFPPPRPWSTSQYADAVTAFEDTGFVVLSDFKILTRPCTRREASYENYGGGMALASAGVRGGPVGAHIKPMRAPPRPSATTPAALDSDIMPTAFSADRSSVHEVAKFGGSGTKSVVDIRSFFPETWLFDLIQIGESGDLVTKVTLPHTITEWIGNAVCINEKDGLGLSDTAKIKGFQAFFIGFTLPYSVIRGEKVPLLVSIFNYLDKCLPVTRTISAVVIAENGTVMSESSTSNDVCVCGGDTETFKYMYTPEHLGNLNLTVLAESAQSTDVCGDKETADVVARDMATKSLEVEAEGFPQENVYSFLFCPDDYDESTYNEKLELKVPSDYVQGSQRAFISVSGDIMGPAIDGLDRLVRLPTGCGEQNMVLFTPNIIVLDYLTSVGKLTENVKTKALENLRTGYQRELKYRHPDGSFSAFGISDRGGSTWLTAFVLKSFAQATKYIDIDEAVLKKSTSWIVEKQLPDGCFPEVGKMLSPGMKGGVGSEGKDTSRLTAYVVTALLISGYNNETAINAAFECIGRDTNLTPYTAALFGYCAAIAERPEVDKYLEYLSQTKETKGDETFWKNVNGSKSLDVETAAYAILTILKTKGDAGLFEALSIVRHMTRMRNSQGGFISTQDTVVGLEAISLFASMISQDPVDLKVQLSGEELNEAIAITEDDKLLVKKTRVPVTPSTVQATATGTGCGLLQAAVRYNTLTVPKQPFFSLTVNAERSPGICKAALITVCASYLPEGRKSNMALVEVKLVSGFTVVKDVLDEIVAVNMAGVKRYEIENNKVVLYFDELTNSKMCLSFVVEEELPVEDRKPATVKVYDYYDGEKQESAEYSIPEKC